jgi:hypothetical protein
MHENPRFDPAKSDIYRRHIDNNLNSYELLIAKHQTPQPQDESRIDATVWLGNRISGFLVAIFDPDDREMALRSLQDAITVTQAVTQNDWQPLRQLLLSEARKLFRSAVERSEFGVDIAAESDEREATAFRNIAGAI